FSCDGSLSFIRESLNQTSIDPSTSCTHPQVRKQLKVLRTQLDPDHGSVCLIPEGALFAETRLATLHAVDVPVTDACHLL
ncbi:hypothetical protein AVEN_72642-1, partial [Araneus ventricosus]